MLYFDTYCTRLYEVIYIIMYVHHACDLLTRKLTCPPKINYWTLFSQIQKNSKLTGGVEVRITQDGPHRLIWCFCWVFNFRACLGLNCRCEGCIQQGLGHLGSLIATRWMSVLLGLARCKWRWPSQPRRWPMTLGKGTGQCSNSVIYVCEMQWPWNRQQIGFYPRFFCAHIGRFEGDNSSCISWWGPDICLMSTIFPSKIMREGSFHDFSMKHHNHRSVANCFLGIRKWPVQFLDDFSNDAVVPAEGDTNSPSTEGSATVMLSTCTWYCSRTCSSIQ